MGHPMPFAEQASTGSDRSRKMTWHLAINGDLSKVTPRLLTLAGFLFQACLIENPYPASMIDYQPGRLEIPGGLANAHSARAQYHGNGFVCHYKFVVRSGMIVQRQQQAGESLCHCMMLAARN